MKNQYFGRIRNLKLRIYRYIIQHSDKMILSKIDLEQDEHLFLRESDFSILDNEKWIKHEEDIFKLTQEGTTEKESWIKKINLAEASNQKNRELENRLTELYKEIKKIIFNYSNKQKENEEEKHKELMTKAIDICETLHWIYLPDYSDTMIDNRGISPEENTKEYYDHFHSIEDLVRHINGDKVKLSKLGDINLHRKYRFVLYTNRWGHTDTYQIERTLEGWIVYFNFDKGNFADNKSANKSLMSIFDQDNIKYPAQIFKAFEYLWDIANDEEMTPKDLQSCINELADWINITEQNVAPFLSKYNIM